MVIDVRYIIMLFTTADQMLQTYMLYFFCLATGLSFTSMMGVYPPKNLNIMVGNRVESCLNLSQSFKVQN